MKYSALATLAFTTLSVGSVLAQTVPPPNLYDNITGVTAVSRFTATPQNLLQGDEVNLVLNPAGPANTTVNGFSVLVFVAVPGAYTFTMCVLEDPCFIPFPPVPPAGGCVTGTVNIPAGSPAGVYRINANGIPAIVSNGSNSRWVQFKSQSSNFTWVFADHIPVMGSSTDGLYIDFNPLDGLLTCSDFINPPGLNDNLCFTLGGIQGNKAATHPTFEAILTDIPCRVIDGATDFLKK